MKIGLTFQVLVFFVTLLTFSMPFVSLAQSSTPSSSEIQRQAALDAIRKAETSVNQRLWFWTGCFGTFFGYLTANTYHHPVPTVPLLGKSPEYVASYTDTYITETRKLQSQYALNGCMLGAALQICLPITFTLLTYDD